MNNTTKKIKHKLPDVAKEHNFFVHDGQILKNLHELPTALRKMNKETFAHHVNNEKNDFANWILDVIGQKKLAQKIDKLKSRTAISKAIQIKLRPCM